MIILLYHALFECTKAVTYAVKLWELGGVFQDPSTEVAHLGLNQPLILY